MKPNMIKKWSIALLVAAGAAGLTGCEGMRVDEGASESDHSGIVADRAITGQLSGVVVDEHGRALKGATISAYGLSTESNANGTWTLSNVPITNLVISNVYDNGSSTTLPTDQDADTNSPMVAKGKIYTTFAAPGHATFHSTYEGAIAVITHSGDESGANSIVVSEISATIPYVELAKMDRTLTGTVYDLGESNYAFQKAVTANVQMRLLPNYVTDNLYGFDGVATDLQDPTVAGAVNEVVSEEFSPGYYGVDPVTVGLDGDGKFTITGAGALRSGYELRVDGTGWRPAQYPQWNTGNEQTLIRVFDANNEAIQDVVSGVAGQTNGPGTQIEDGAYWKIEKLNIATGTNSLATDFGNLYVQNFEAQDGTPPELAILSYLGGPDNLDTDGDRTFHNDNITVDSDVATALGTTQPIVVVFDQDMRSIATMPANGVRLYNDKLESVAIESAVLDGRTLSIKTVAALAEGNYRLVLKRDIFVDKNGERLAASAQFSQQAVDQQFDSVFGINYGTSAYGHTEVTDLVQSPRSDSALGGTAAPALLVRNVNNTTNAVEQTRVQQLRDAISWTLSNGASPTTNDLTFDEFVDDDNASLDRGVVTFTAVKGEGYKVTITDQLGSKIAATADFGAGTINFDAASTQTGGQSSVDAQFTASQGGAVTLNIDNASVGYGVAVTSLGELETSSQSTMAITLEDREIPRVALQFSSNNGQDNGSVVLFNIVSTDEAGEIVYDGKTQAVYPKLNLTASLYDKSGYRGRSEVSDTNINGDAALNDDLAIFSLQTPLLNTTAATTTQVGTTNSGRSDRFYNNEDYVQWLTTTAGAGTDACTYYVADAGNDVSWYKSDAAGVVETPFVKIEDTDEVNTTYEGFIAADNSSLDVVVHGADANGEPVVKYPSNCGQPGDTIYGDPNRTIVIEMTEDVDTITYNADFKGQSGASLEDETSTYAARTNVITGSDLDSQIMDLDNAAAGERHLLLKLKDWRAVDDSPRYDSTAQNEVANTVAEGISVKSLLQLVTAQDLVGNDIKATSGHATGVLLADATPPLLTEATVDEDSITLTFDQPVSTSLTGGLTVTGSAANYTVGAIAAGSANISRDTAYIDQYGNNVVGGSNVAFTASVSSNVVTLTVADNATHDFSGFLSGATHSSAANLGDAGTKLHATTAPTLYVEYGALQDTNFNSWDQLTANGENFDYFDDGGSPRFVPVDTLAPKLLFQTSYDYQGADNSSVFLYKYDTDPVSLDNAYMTLDTDNDTTYTGATAVTLTGLSITAGTAGEVDTGATGSLTEDLPLFFLWNQNTTTGAERIPSTDAGDYARLVLDLSASVTSVDGARVFYYQPAYDNVTTGATGSNGISIPDLTIDTQNTAAGSKNDNSTIAIGENGELIVAFPEVSVAGGTDEVSTHRLVIDNVTIGGVQWTLQVHAPNVSNTDTTLITTETTEAIAKANLPVIDFYRKVYLPTTSTVGSLAVGSDNGTDPYKANFTVSFTEPLASVTGVSYGIGTNYTENTGTANTTDVLTLSVPSTATPTNTATSGTATLSLSTAFGETTSTTKRIGHGASLSFSATDFDGNTSATTITLRRGHGVSSNGRTVILNEISSSGSTTNSIGGNSVD